MVRKLNFVAQSQALMNPSLAPEERLKLVSEVRENIEIGHSPDYALFLQSMFPKLRRVLEEITKPQFVDGPIQKTRHLVLDILHRVPYNEVFREYVKPLGQLAMSMLQKENEENAVICLRIIFDLYKSFKQSLKEQVQAFLTFVCTLYNNFPNTVEINLGNSSQGHSSEGTIAKSTESFKVMIECPMIVMVLLQLYQDLLMQPRIKILLPLMIKTIEIRAPHGAANKKAVYQEFIAAQVKTVSFLSYLLRHFRELMDQYKVTIPKSIVQVLAACPGDAVASRKELLVATKHILNTEFRQGFYDQIQMFLDEKVLIGTGRAAYETLRPLAYSFLAELVHHVRSALKHNQFSLIIYIFSTNVHDPSLSYVIKTTSVRLLANLVESIYHKSDMKDEEKRQLLVRIVDTIVNKYSSMTVQVPRILQRIEDSKKPESKDSKLMPLTEEPLTDPMRELNDAKQLLKALTLGLKTVVWSVNNLTLPAQAGVPSRHRKGLLEEECVMLAKMITSVPECFKLYGTTRT